MRQPLVILISLLILISFLPGVVLYGGDIRESERTGFNSSPAFARAGSGVEKRSGILDNFENEYYIKPGDVFSISIIGAETENFILVVTIEGQLPLYPLAPSVQVAGKSLANAKELIKSTVLKHYQDVKVDVLLHRVSPQNIHILGAVNHPGQYIVDSLTTLYRTLQEKAGGITPAGSRKVSIIRRGETRLFNLNDYLRYGSIQENPLLFNEDVVYVDFAEDFAKLYVVTDTVNYVEYFEIEKPVSLRTLLLSIGRKYGHSDYTDLFLFSDGRLAPVSQDYLVKKDDTIYVRPEESYIYVRGNVNRPGRFTYLPDKIPHFYLSLAGGVTRYGTERRLIIVKEDGNSFRYRGQEIEQGDTIVVPLSTRIFITDYLTPISAALSIIATIVVLTR